MNVAHQISNSATRYPYKKAVVMPHRLGKTMAYSHYTYSQLEQRINQFANQLQQQGVTAGERVLLFVRPSLDFSALCFALFKIGAVVVLIDPGMGIKKLVNAISEVQASSMVAVPVVHWLRHLFPAKFRSVSKYFSLGFAPGAKNLLHNLEKASSDFTAFEAGAQDAAAILFTSGGTGRPKGVIYTHDIFIAQTQMLQKEFELTEFDVDIPGFPLFALFTLAMGMTSCIPLMNPARPGRANPQWLVKNIIDQSATFVAGSPAIWEKVANYCLKYNIQLPTVKYLVMFGAPIPLSLHEKFQTLLPKGTTYTPYGATECLPVSNISGRELLEEFSSKMRQGQGTCIGRPLERVEVKIILPNKGVISEFHQAQQLQPLEVGEIIVKSPTVTPGYYSLANHTMLAKIYEQDQIWHRMGDMGYLDQKGNLWFCGRVAHVVEAQGKQHYSIPIEAIFNQHPSVRRSALVGLQLPEGMVPAIVIQLHGHGILTPSKKKMLLEELLKIAQMYPHTQYIKHIFFKRHFPLDVRHNIKIDRKALGEWVNRGKKQ